MRNPRHLNAEDDTTLAATEVAVDLALLDPEVEICVLRGGVVDHPRYAGRRILGAGINLTHLYRGLVSYLFYVVRDLGYVSKIYRGLSGPEFRYMALYAREQAFCHLSPALVRNLERNWSAHERRL
jgi:thioesterase DpgC